MAIFLYVHSSCWRRNQCIVRARERRIGETKDGTENTHFGYIFGSSSSSFNRFDVMRHPLVSKIIEKYEEYYD